MRAAVVYCHCMSIREINEQNVAADVEEVQKRLPAGSVAAVVCEREELLGAYARRMRKAGVALRRLPLCLTAETLDKTEADADVRMVVAVGGNTAADCAKYLGKRWGLPVFAAVGSPCALRVLDPYCLLWSGGIWRCVAGAAPCAAALLQEGVTATDNQLPAAFGDIVATAVHLFDLEATERAAGRTPPADLRERVLDIIYAALEQAAQGGRHDPKTAAVLAQAALDLAALSQQKTVLLHGGAESCARTAHMLFSYESRPPLLHGETAFLFGAVLARMYRAFADAPNVFMPPPDNNLRAEKLCEFLGWRETAAVRAASGRLSSSALTAYRLHEYRDELGGLAADVCKLFEEAKRPFRRLYADDGFGCKGVLDESDVRTVAALAPDTFAVAPSALALMRALGFLERYLP